MKVVLFLILAPMMVGCAHQSVHDYCVKHVSEYKDYDECHADYKEERENRKKRAAAFNKGFSNGFKKDTFTCTPSYNNNYTCER